MDHDNDRRSEQFTGRRETVQFELCPELRQGLRLSASKSGRSMSDLAVEAQATRATISRVNFSDRKAG